MLRLVLFLLLSTTVNSEYFLFQGDHAQVVKGLFERFVSLFNSGHVEQSVKQTFYGNAFFQQNVRTLCSSGCTFSGWDAMINHLKSVKSQGNFYASRMVTTPEYDARTNSIVATGSVKQGVLTCLLKMRVRNGKFINVEMSVW